jgi:hypothetical protein
MDKGKNALAHLQLVGDLAQKTRSLKIYLSSAFLFESRFLFIFAKNYPATNSLTLNVFSPLAFAITGTGEFPLPATFHRHQGCRKIQVDRRS